ncbi:hypothetical protein C8F01DRAFT_1241916 [Mycena amicta]|nr:hypothetical protein C8F01DRAFT_1241916 [Mycena amicta]
MSPDAHLSSAQLVLLVLRASVVLLPAHHGRAGSSAEVPGGIPDVGHSRHPTPLVFSVCKSTPSLPSPKLNHSTFAGSVSCCLPAFAFTPSIPHADLLPYALLECNLTFIDSTSHYLLRFSLAISFWMSRIRSTRTGSFGQNIAHCSRDDRRFSARRDCCERSCVFLNTECPLLGAYPAKSLTLGHRASPCLPALTSTADQIAPSALAPYLASSIRSSFPNAP